MSVLQSLKEKCNDGSKGVLNCCATTWESHYPGIWEVLACHTHDGKKRRTGKLLVYTELGSVTLVLTDVDSGQVLFWTKDDLDLALESLEAALQLGEAPWRADKRRGR